MLITLSLNRIQDKWIPSFTITSILLCIRTLMTDPNPTHPLVGTIGAIFLSNKELYETTAKDWTRKYASSKNKKNSS